MSATRENLVRGIVTNAATDYRRGRSLDQAVRRVHREHGSYPTWPADLVRATYAGMSGR